MSKVRIRFGLAMAAPDLRSRTLEKEDRLLRQKKLDLDERAIIAKSGVARRVWMCVADASYAGLGRERGWLKMILAQPLSYLCLRWLSELGGL